MQTTDIVKMNLVRLFMFNVWINRRTYFIYWVNKVHLLLRLVFTSNGITVGIISIDVRALMTLWKSKIGVISRVISALDQSRRNQNVSIFFRLCLWLSNWRSSENQIVGFGSRIVRINQSQCMFPCFVMDVYKTWTSSPWTPTPVDHLLFLKMNFTRGSKQILGTLNGMWSGLWATLILHLFKFFSFPIRPLVWWRSNQPYLKGAGGVVGRE